ncbi:uncharacterized protein PFLUO_LOCUS3905 [Penicillium psychrofluorescens]|uniref:uncharacterized protein n=1 Tax=Penicillium psychrofluorescens TaxID=3158075 RepID=UPI003CCD1675
MSVPTQPSSTGDHEYLVTPGEQNTQTNGIKPVHQDSDDHPDHAKEAYRLFNVWKDVALGPNISYSLQVHPSGGRAQTPSPVFHTPRIPWYRQRYHLPASFDLYAGGTVIRSSKDPQPEPEDRRSHIHYRGVEGVFTLRVDADIFSQPDGASEPVKRCSVRIARKGIGRTYSVQIYQDGSGSVQKFYWKGSKAALSLVEDREHDGNGNLKFFAADRPQEILAVWQNRTDRRILGSLSVLATLDEGPDGVLEALVVSCLAVVLSERLSGRGWLGGLGKSTG